MNIFSEIQGLKEENMTSAVLRMLLLQSHQLRDAFLELLSRESKQGPIFSVSKFSCETELHTYDEKYGRGRVDFVLETDKFLIGVENKIRADFQPNQPHKYIESLKERSKKFFKNGGVSEDLNTILVIMAPQSRLNQIKDNIGKMTDISDSDKNIFLFISWDEVITSFQKVLDKCDNITQIYFNDLSEYMMSIISIFPNYKVTFPHLRNSFEQYGNPFQRDFVGRIWRFFPKPGKRISQGVEWCGYYFNYPQSSSDIVNQCWYGFIPPSQLINPPSHYKSAELVIVVPYDKLIEDQCLTPVELKNKNFSAAGIGKDKAFIVNFDINWDSPELWEEMIEKYFTV